MKKFFSLIALSLVAFVASFSTEAKKPTFELPKSQKVTLVGDCGVGKTSVFWRMLNDTFDSTIAPTIGSAFTGLKLVAENGNEVTLNIWDTAGQERYRALIPSYFRDSDILILMYSVDDKESKDSISYWNKYISDNSNIPSDRIILVENKTDLKDYNDGEVLDIARQFGFCSAVSTSALTGTGIDILKSVLADLADEIKQFDSMRLQVTAKSDSRRTTCCK